MYMRLHLRRGGLIRLLRIVAVPLRQPVAGFYRRGTDIML